MDFRVNWVDQYDNVLDAYLVQRDNMPQVFKAIANRMLQSPHLIPDQCVGFWTEIWESPETLKITPLKSDYDEPEEVSDDAVLARLRQIKQDEK